MTNSVEPDQTAPFGAVWSGFGLGLAICPNPKKFYSISLLYELSNEGLHC